MFRSYFSNIRLTVRDALFDEIEQFLSSEALFRGADEHRWKFLPLFAERFAEAGDTAVGLCFRQFVRFREYDAERDAVLTEHLDEIQVDGLRFESDVDQYEEEMEPFAAEYIIEDDFRELAAGRLRGAGIAVAGQVDQIPTVVDAEMVDKPCLPGVPETLASPWRPVSMLMSDDLPTLLRPMNAMSGRVSFGTCAMRSEEHLNWAFRICMTVFVAGYPE